MTSMRIIIFAKAPLPGLAKTRLIPALGADKAARLAHRMLLHSIAEARRSGADEVELCVTPGPRDAAWQSIAIAGPCTWTAQGDGDLGERLARASARASAAGCHVLLMGTDCPALDGEALQSAIKALHTTEAAMIPTADGGYALLGFRHFHPNLFAGIHWSTASVAAETQKRIEALSWSLTLLPRLHDIDEPDDLQWLPSSWLIDSEAGSR